MAPASGNPSAKSAPNEFGPNAFDPKGFYGEDEEEEEEEEEEQDIGHGSYTAHHHSADLRPANEPPAFHSEETLRAHIDQSPPDSRFTNDCHVPAELPTTGGQAAVTTNERLTTDDLLDLFGASSQGESIAEATEPKPVQEEPTAVAQTDDFALPPPSDSSDDEDE
jgi:hypothetical protein